MCNSRLTSEQNDCTTSLTKKIIVSLEKEQLFSKKVSNHKYAQGFWLSWLFHSYFLLVSETRKIPGLNQIAFAHFLMGLPVNLLRYEGECQLVPLLLSHEDRH